MGIPWQRPEKPFLRRFSLDHQHGKVCKLLRLPSAFVIHSLRHTYGTRLGEAAADVFTIMRLMGHSSVTVSQRYVHPSPKSVKDTVERLESLDRKSTERLAEGKNDVYLLQFPLY